MLQTVSDEIMRKLNDSGSKKVKVAIADIDGVLRGKYIHLNKFESARKNGFGFCNVVFGWDSSDTCYTNSQYTGWHSGYPDAEARIDMNTLRFIPWDERTPFFLADFERNGEPLPICPRQVLKRVVRLLDKMGLRAKVGCEFEWFAFKETPTSLREKNYKNLTNLSPGMFGYSILRSSLNQEFFKNLMGMMQDFDVPLEGLHTETGPGALEAALIACDPLEAGDRAVLFKTGAKEIANKLDVTATFMARWDNSKPGAGGHIHMSLMDKEGQPLFYDAKDRYHMSPLFQSFLAGQLTYLHELMPMLAPTVNSFKRLVEGFWAPTRSTWGIDNRTVALRVINSQPGATRVEVRVPGADMNPYLGIAAALGAGLLGVKNKLSLAQAPVIGNGYMAKDAKPFASNLREAAQKFEQSSIATDLLGKEFVEHFAATRMWEWEQGQKAVTDWELQRYFEII
ncbi:MAG: glutamine synthetase [Deltaproteobacteria bacterium]|nr:glutamine synthetase [Deltaproteobacteria bacterium]